MISMHIGWVRFKLNQFVTIAPSTSSSEDGDWTTAFYFTPVDKIRAILDQGQPLPIGNELIINNLLIKRMRKL